MIISCLTGYIRFHLHAFRYRETERDLYVSGTSLSYNLPPRIIIYSDRRCDMNIVITGAGKVGNTLCADLVKEDHNIIMIEKDESRLEQAINSYDIGGICGNGAIYDTQMDAEVNKCDVFIAVTSDDETNIIAAITAKKLGAKYTIARVRSPEYSKQVGFLRESLGITLMINPELDAALAIERILLFPAALGVETFGLGRINMIEVVLRDDSPMTGIKLRDHNGRFGNIIVCVVARGNDVFIPDGETCLQAGDHVMITGSTSNVHTFCTQSYHGLTKVRSALIVGGGRVTNYLVSRLIKQHMHVKIIEKKLETATRLASEFTQAEVIYGDGTAHTLLNEERIADYDSVIALTGIDEENILISIYASRMGVPITITKVNRTDLLKVLDNVGLQAIITPQNLISDHIVRFIRSVDNSEGSNIEAFYRLADGRVEVLQFRAKESGRSVKMTLTDLPTKPGVLIICIIRGDNVIYPGGSDQIRPGDEVIVATTNKGFQDLDDILQETRGHK